MCEYIYTESQSKQGANANIWLRNVWNRFLANPMGTEIPMLKLLESKTKWRQYRGQSRTKKFRILTTNNPNVTPCCQIQAKRCARMCRALKSSAKKLKYYSFSFFQFFFFIRTCYARYADTECLQLYGIWSTDCECFSILTHNCGNKKMCVSKYNLMLLFFPLGTSVVISVFILSFFFLSSFRFTYFAFSF